jgi:hypothetical protein
VLETPRGDFSVAVFDLGAAALPLTIRRGSDEPFEGWLSRHYGEREPVPSMSVRISDELPITLISVLGANTAHLSKYQSRYELRSAARTVSFGLSDGLVTSWEVP